MADNQTHSNLVSICYKFLKEKIIQGAFLPGEKLRVAHLKKQLNAGATPIREALSRLAASGLVETEENKGFRVKSISEMEVRDIYATFCKIELLALSQAISLGDIAWEANILAALHRLSVVEHGETVDIYVWLQCNYDFHVSLIAGCQSPCLLGVRDTVYQQFDRYCHLSLLINTASLALNHREHHAIAKAVIARDLAQACRLTELHLECSLTQVVERLKPSFAANHKAGLKNLVGKS